MRLVYSPDSALTGLGYSDIEHTFGQHFGLKSITLSQTLTEGEPVLQYKICVEDGDLDNYNDLKKFKLKTQSDTHTLWGSGDQCDGLTYEILPGKLIGFAVKIGYYDFLDSINIYSLRGAAVITDSNSCDTIRQVGTLDPIEFQMIASSPVAISFTQKITTAYSQQCTFATSLDPPASFASIVADSVSVQTTDITLTGLHAIDLVLTPDPTESVVTEVRYPISIRISICEMTDFKKDSTSIPNDRSIPINAAYFETIDQTFTWTPAECESYYPMIPTFDYTKDGLTVSQPNFLALVPDGVVNRFGYYPTDPADIGVYTIKWTITIPTSTNFPGDADMVVVNTHQIQIYLPCDMAVVTILPTFIPNTSVNYIIGDSRKTEELARDQWTTTTTWSCPNVYYEFVQTPTDPASAASFSWHIHDSSTIKFRIETSDRSVEGVYTFTLYVGYCDGDCATDIYTQRDQVDFTVTLIDPCPTETISISSSMLTSLPVTYNIYNEPDVQVIDYGKINRSVTTIKCPDIILTVEMQDPLLSFDPSVMIFDNTTNLLTTSTNETAKVNTYDLRISGVSVDYPTITAILDFQIIVDDPCKFANLEISSEFFSFVYPFDSGPMKLQLDSQMIVSNVTSVCPDYYFMMQARPYGPYDSEVFNLDGLSYLLTIQTSNYKKIGVYPLQLMIQYVGNEDWYTNRSYLDFSVRVYDQCQDDTLILTEQVIDLSGKVKYSIYNTPLVLDTDPWAVSSKLNMRSECPRIILDVINEDNTGLDPMFRYDAFANQLIVQSKDPYKTGTYRLQVVAQYEGLQYSKFGHTFQVGIDDPCHQAILTVDPTIVPSMIIDYQVGEFVKSISFDARRVGSTIPFCPEYTFSLTQQNGEQLDPDVFAQFPAMLKIFTQDYSKIGIYHIKMTVRFKSDAYQNYAEFVFEVDINLGQESSGDQLRPSSYAIDRQGLLEIEYDQPLSVPDQYINDGSEDYKSLSKDLLSLSVFSTFYEKDFSEIGILDYSLVQYDGGVIQIQVDFAKPEMLSLIATEPDQLMVVFKEEVKSISQNIQRENTLLLVKIPQQISLAQSEQLKALEESVKRPAVYFSAFQLALNLAIGAGLKHMWKVVNVLQFVVYFLVWQVNVPPNANIFIKQVKNLAFFEFLTDWIFTLLDNKFKDCQGAEKCGNFFEQVAQSALFRNAGVMAVAALSLTLTTAALGILYIVGKYSSKVLSVVIKIKNALFWNTFIRYTLQSTLKLQVSAVIVLNFTTKAQQSYLSQNKRLLQDTADPEQGESQTSLFFPVCMLIVMNLMPIIFAVTLFRHRASLEQESTKQKIGSMYQTVQPKDAATLCYPSIFLLRRSLFVALSFALFNYPCIQTQLQLFTIMLYLTYVSFGVVYDSSVTRNMELFNEIIFLVASYHMMLYVSPWLLTDRPSLGWSLIGTIVFMIVVNYCIIFGMAIRDLKEKLRMYRYGRKKAELLDQRKAVVDKIDKRYSELKLRGSEKEMNRMIEKMKQAELSKHDEKLRNLFDDFKGVKKSEMRTLEMNLDKSFASSDSNRQIQREESKELQVESFSEASLAHEVKSDHDLLPSTNESGPLALRGLLGQNSSLLAQIEFTPAKGQILPKTRHKPDRDIQLATDFQTPSTISQIEYIGKNRDSAFGLMPNSNGENQGKSSDGFGSNLILEDLEQRLIQNRRGRLQNYSSSQMALENLERRVGITGMVSDHEIDLFQNEMVIGQSYVSKPIEPIIKSSLGRNQNEK